ncbi:MAG: hypothetical protein KDA79_01790 [Planctomycetaceae bacterium]|nr:hypothetical protein [Planctomycetaceae bacterium]
MTFVGKILVVLQVVLSVCFMAFAGAVFTFQANWRTQYDTAQKQAADVQADLDTLREEFEGFRNTSSADLQTQTDRARDFEAQVASLTADLQRERQLHETTRTALDTQRSVATIAGDEARARQQETMVRRQANSTLHKTVEQLNDEVRKLESEIFARNLEISRIEKKHERILEEFAFLQQVVRTHDLPTDPREYRDKTAPPPAVDGLVLATRQAKDTRTEFVEISIGSDDGLQKGHSLFVYRTSGKGDYLGRIEIVSVSPDRAVGTVISKAKNGVIEKGDNVTTKL